jgi:uncharacterized protein (DUF433 family)
MPSASGGGVTRRPKSGLQSIPLLTLWLLHSRGRGGGDDRRHRQGSTCSRSEPVFRGTRVPFRVLIEYLEGGDTVDQFLEQYSSATREVAIAAIEEARLSLVSENEGLDWEEVRNGP